MNRHIKKYVGLAIGVSLLALPGLAAAQSVPYQYQNSYSNSSNYYCPPNASYPCMQPQQQYQAPQQQYQPQQSNYYCPPSASYPCMQPQQPTYTQPCCNYTPPPPVPKPCCTYQPPVYYYYPCYYPTYTTQKSRMQPAYGYNYGGGYASANANVNVNVNNNVNSGYGYGGYWYGGW